MGAKLRAVLLGGTGFLGSAISARTEAAGVDVIIAGRAGSAAGAYPWDIADLADAGRAFSELRPDVVINLAAAGVTRGTADRALMHAVNASGPANLVEAITASSHPPSLIHVASSRELDLPLAPDAPGSYGSSKAQGTGVVRTALREGSINGTILRIHSAYGIGQPADRFVAWMVQRVRAQQPIELHEPERALDFVHVTDVVDAFARALTCAVTTDEIIDIGTGHVTTVREAAEIAVRSASSDLSLIRVAASPSPHISRAPADTSAARRHLDWEAQINIADGLRALVQARP